MSVWRPGTYIIEYSDAIYSAAVNGIVPGQLHCSRALALPSLRPRLAVARSPWFCSATNGSRNLQQNIRSSSPREIVEARVLSPKPKSFDLSSEPKMLMVSRVDTSLFLLICHFFVRILSTDISGSIRRTWTRISIKHTNKSASNVFIIVCSSGFKEVFPLNRPAINLDLMVDGRSATASD